MTRTDRTARNAARAAARIDYMLSSLTSKGAMTGPALCSWLGNPHYFMQNLNALVEDGRVTITCKHTNFGVVRYYSAA
jgi:hypothetical protein